MMLLPISPVRIHASHTKVALFRGGKKTLFVSQNIDRDLPKSIRTSERNTEMSIITNHIDGSANYLSQIPYSDIYPNMFFVFDHFATDFPSTSRLVEAT